MSRIAIRNGSLVILEDIMSADTTRVESPRYLSGTTGRMDSPNHLTDEMWFLTDTGFSPPNVQSGSKFSLRSRYNKFLNAHGGGFVFGLADALGPDETFTLRLADNPNNEKELYSGARVLLITRLGNDLLRTIWAPEEINKFRYMLRVNAANTVDGTPVINHFGTTIRMVFDYDMFKNPVIVDLEPGESIRVFTRAEDRLDSHLRLFDGVNSTSLISEVFIKRGPAHPGSQVTIKPDGSMVVS